MLRVTCPIPQVTCAKSHRARMHVACRMSCAACRVRHMRARHRQSRVSCAQVAGIKRDESTNTFSGQKGGAAVKISRLNLVDLAGIPPRHGIPHGMVSHKLSPIRRRLGEGRQGGHDGSAAGRGDQHQQVAHDAWDGDWAHPCHICTGTGLTCCHICTLWAGYHGAREAVQDRQEGAHPVYASLAPFCRAARMHAHAHPPLEVR